MIKRFCYKNKCEDALMEQQVWDNLRVNLNVQFIDRFWLLLETWTPQFKDYFRCSTSSFPGGLKIVLGCPRLPEYVLSTLTVLAHLCIPSSPQQITEQFGLSFLSGDIAQNFTQQKFFGDVDGVVRSARARSLQPTAHFVGGVMLIVLLRLHSLLCSLIGKS